MRAWRRFWRLPAVDRRLVVETTLALALARVVVMMLPLRGLGWLASRRVRASAPPARADVTRRIRWAVTACASYVPWRALCFEQGLAAQLLLRRCGIPAVLHVGAALDDQTGFAAHAWVRDGDTDVVGCEIADQFSLLTSFPPRT